MKNGKILPFAPLPVQGMKGCIRIHNGTLLIEFDKEVSWLQFNKADAQRFVQAIALQIKTMA